MIFGMTYRKSMSFSCKIKVRALCTMFSVETENMAKGLHKLVVEMQMPSDCLYDIYALY